ncbi:DUF4397 domain-containing protein [Sphingobacterium psychroaquaticum]|uniref:DUF4397 domain-containing protein n=1 Tax=Sphingobacterium psychroaquaticum TaxID=561061 RepID=UPI00106D7962|nr:DUF4397 domain-containing protein [Sphingobacterium psychroaquaticum]QBQ42041.1 DUF4397 domain-containing protein [Sphingobacterium psychroaquaticum]
MKKLILYILLLPLAVSCKKEKLDLKPDNRPTTEARKGSQVRIVNLVGYNQVIANGDSLTNFVTRNSNNPDYYKYPGTSYFPTDGRLGKTWTIPQDLFDQQQQLDLQISLRNYQSAGDMDMRVKVQENYAHPTDYYLLNHLFMNGQPEVVEVPRDVSSPSKPDHFKIRIVNLGGEIKRLTMGLTGMQEDLKGPVSLAYADGTLVHNKTNQVSTQVKASEYIELPYGTYQFKVLVGDGRQVPSLGNERAEYKVIDPASSTIPLDHAKLTNLHYAAVKTYQPGGVYTIVVTPQRYDYIVDEIGNTSWLYQNSFQVITDVSALANQTYVRLQGANAYTDKTVSFKVNGKTVGEKVSFGEATDYSVQIHGTYKVEAVDAGGQVLASLDQVLQPAQNYTFWLHPNADGSPRLLAVANDLSGAVFTGATDDGTFARTQHQFFFFKRFLNLAVGNPYITFTLNNGQLGNSGVGSSLPNQNLQPGLPKLEGPYMDLGNVQTPFDIMAYRSTPEVVPGLWASDIASLSHQRFIANEALYLRPNRPLPIQEPGVYTVALIGHTGNTATPTNKARMIIIKHTK